MVAVMGTGVQPSLLLEREDDLARIDGSLARARDGHGTLVVVEGPAGMGKTALLADARAIAGSAGMQVLRSRGAELEREFAFGVVRQLLEPVLRGLDDAARPPPGARRRRGRPARAARAPGARRRRRSRTRTRRSRSSTACTGSAPTSPGGGRCAWSWTTRTGPTPRRCGS